MMGTWRDPGNLIGEVFIIDASKNEKQEKAPALFDLTNLQREANGRLGYTAQQTLDYTQSLYEKKLSSSKKNVFFLPKMIPEDIIYNEARLKSFLGEDDFPDISNEKDAKAKLKKLADSMGQEIEQIEYQLIYWFIKQKTQIIRLF